MTTDAIWQLMTTEKLNGLSLNDVVGGGDPEGVGSLNCTVLQRVGAVTPSSKVLDIGCGCGRSAVPLASYLRPPGSYVGVDIIPALVNFCRREITTRSPNFRFHTLRQDSEQYRSFIERDQETAWLDSMAELDRDFDLAMAFSLFTHLDVAATEEMLETIFDRLRYGGFAVLTFFILNPFARASIAAGRANVFRNMAAEGDVVFDVFNGPRSAVGFEEDKLLSIIHASRFGRPQSLHYGSWSCATGLHYQDIVVLRKDPQLPADFEPQAYLAANPDVRSAGTNPYFHYHLYGRNEGRRLRP
jgi:SAM-dependent methyltransferase